MIDYDLKDRPQRPTTDHNHKDSQLWMKEIVVVVDWRSSTTTIFVPV